jgi:hypothetical protein
MAALQHSAQAMAAQINTMLGLNAPEPGTRANGWFGGYGCRWCEASRAWFTVLPFDAEPVAAKVAELFKVGGAREVTITDEGGVSEAAGGRGLQVSAYIFRECQ